MAQIFNFSRFFNFLKSELILKYKYYLIAGLTIMPIIILELVDRAFFDSYSGPVSMVSYGILIGFICLIIPSFLYKDIFHKVNGVNYTMVPASNSEKFLSIWFQGVVIIPLFMALAFTLCMLIISFFAELEFPNIFSFYFSGNAYMPEAGLKTDFFLSPYWIIISMQSFVIWGICFFKNHKFGKTLLSAIILGIAAILVLALILRIFGTYVGDGFNFISPGNIGFLEIIAKILNIAFPFIFWILAYYKFTRQQV